MDNRLRINDLLRAFSSVERKEWEHAAVGEINNNSPDEKLAWKGPENLTFLPYYDSTNVTVNFSNIFQLIPNEKDPRSWLNLPPVMLNDDSNVREKIVNHLNHSANGVFLHLAEKTSLNVAQLLAGVDAESHFSFYCTNNDRLSSVKEFLNQSSHKIHGNLFCHTFPKDTEPLLRNFSSFKNFSFFGIYIEQASPVLEITNALVKGVKLIDGLTEKGFPAEEVIPDISFSLEAGNNFFYTVAKLKALRLLWYQVARAYNFNDYHNDNLHLHIRSDVFSQESFNPHGNMLKGTTSALAAIAGGANALSVYPEDPRNEMMCRIARNVSIILKEEAHMSRVADPLSGSFLLEKMIYDFAQCAWSNFQKEIR